MKKLYTVILLLVLFTALFTGCNKTQNAGATTGAQPTATVTNTASADITITDFLNRTVTVKNAPAKIVSLTASNTEILYALGLGDKVVGVDAFSDYPAEAKTKETVGDYNGPTLEKIIALEPDIVFASNKLQTEVISSLEKVGILVISSEASTYEQIYTSVEMIGQASFADAAKIDEIKQGMRNTEAQIKALAKDKPVKKTYYVLSYGEYGDWSVGPGSYIYDILIMAGCAPITKDTPYPFPKFSIETVVAENPELIIYDNLSCKLKDLQAANGYKELDAIKNSSAIEADGNKLGRPTPRMMEEALVLAQNIWK